ncbi:MAG: zf-HC2 domain-containing protein [Pirellulales bacterium]
MNEHHEEPIADEWQACPPGELAAIGSHARATRRRRALRITGVGVATVFALVAAVWISLDMPWSLPLRRNVAEIDCPTCKQRLAEYERGSLPADQSRQVRDHLAGCAWCRWYRDRYFGRDADGNQQANLGTLAYAGMTPSLAFGGALTNLVSHESNRDADADLRTSRATQHSHENCPCCSGR